MSKSHTHALVAYDTSLDVLCFSFGRLPMPISPNLVCFKGYLATLQLSATHSTSFWLPNTLFLDIFSKSWSPKLTYKCLALSNTLISILGHLLYT